jgi:hypothetical protein
MDRTSIAAYEALTPTREHDVPADEPVANLALARRLADRLERARLAGDSHDLRLAESLTLHVIELLESSIRVGVVQ